MQKEAELNVLRICSNTMITSSIIECMRTGHSVNPETANTRALRTGTDAEVERWIFQFNMAFLSCSSVTYALLFTFLFTFLLLFYFIFTTAGSICLHAWLETRSCFFQLSSQSLWDSGPESRRSSWTSTSRAPSLHRRSQSGEMESLLSDTHSGSYPSSREHSLDQQEYLQVPVLHLPECNGTTFHLPEQCCEDAPLTAHYHSDPEDDEAEEVSSSVSVAL